MENYTLMELFAGKQTLTKAEELYYKMVGLEYDIINNRITVDDYKFFKEHFLDYIFLERKLFIELKGKFLLKIVDKYN